MGRQTGYEKGSDEKHHLDLAAIRCGERIYESFWLSRSQTYCCYSIIRGKASFYKVFGSHCEDDCILVEDKKKCILGSDGGTLTGRKAEQPTAVSVRCLLLGYATIIDWLFDEANIYSFSASGRTRWSHCYFLYDLGRSSRRGKCSPWRARPPMLFKRLANRNLHGLMSELRSL